MIRIDSREPEKWKESITILAKQEGLESKIESLTVGDYMSEHMCIERKDIVDFAISVITGRLDDQLQRLTVYCEAEELIPVLLVHGSIMDIVEVHNQYGGLNPNQTYGAMCSVMVRYGVNFIWIENVDDAKIILVKMLKKSDHWCKPKKVDKTYLASRLLGIHVWQLKDLMNLYGNLTNIGLCSEQQLMSVVGIGDKKAKMIKKILNEPL